jgi:hypothetical protein
MTKVFMAAALLISLHGYAQVPFATYKKPSFKQELHKIASVMNISSDEANAQADSNYQQQLQEITRADYFDHVSANIVATGDLQQIFPTINGEVIHYKLGLWSSRVKNPENRLDTIKMHYLPFSIISKISANYMDPGTGTLNDATSFFGAPLTFRFAPAFDLTPHSEYNKLFVGVQGDLRMLVIGDTAANTIDASWGVYSSFGLTYMGNGYAFDDNGTDDSERHDGKWSFSALLFWAKSGGKFNKAVFGNFEPKQLSGLELMLRFKASSKSDSRFNFFLGGSNGFSRGAPNFARWDFRIGVGN